MLNRSKWIADLLVLLSCCIISVGLCAPAFSRLFASDDYCTLNNIIKNQSVLMPGFFRPVADITLAWTYKLFGFSPFHFYLINALLHGINAWLIYLFIKRFLIVGGISRNELLPFFSAFIFLTYHSVGEVVFWAIGRGVSLAITLSLLASLLFLSNAHRAIRYVGVPLLYLAALSSYESVMLLPFILLATIYLFRLNESLVIWLLLFMAAVMANVFLRVHYSGRIWLAYGGKIFDKNLSESAETLTKSFMRVFMPALDSPPFFVSGSALIILVISACLYAAWRKFPEQRRVIIWVVTALLFAIWPAMFYGASTRTTEGDRFLYFPAVFFSIIVAFTLSIISRLWLCRLCFVLIIISGVMLISRTRGNWMRADIQVRAVIEQLTRPLPRPLFIVGLPGDYNGAYQFRNCFPLIMQYNGVPDPLSVFKMQNDSQSTQATTAYWNGKRLIIDQGR